MKTSILWRRLLGTLPRMLAAAWVVASAPTSAHAAFPQKLWKYQVPPPVKPFGDYDVIGLANGKLIHTNCSTIWLATSGTYCFRGQTSLHQFLTSPRDYGAHAQTFLKRQRD